MKYANLFLGLTLVLFPSSVRPQEPSGSLVGVVIDRQRILVNGAKVLAISRAPSSAVGVRKFETYTNDEGRFGLENLPGGSYEVTVTHSDSEAASEKIVAIAQGKTTEVIFDVGHGCDLLSDDTGLVTNQDKGEVVRLAFLQALDSKFRLLEQRQREKSLIVSTKNIDLEWLHGINAPRIEFLSQTQIQKRANREGDFLFLFFPEIKVRGGCVAVTVSNTWAIGKRSRMIPMSGGGYTFEYRKEAGNWSARFVSGWIS